MLVPKKRLRVSETTDLRQEGGKIIKQMREQTGLSQSDLGRVLGLAGKQFVSMIENGRTRIPLDQVPLWAKALKVEPKQLMKLLMRCYEPLAFAILFEEEAADLSQRFSEVMEQEPVEPAAEAMRWSDMPALIVGMQGQIDALAGHVRTLSGQIESLLEASGPPATAASAPPSATRAPRRRPAER